MANQSGGRQGYPILLGQSPVSPIPGSYDIFGGIDGTGEEDLKDYDKLFADSFVRQNYSYWTKSSAASGNAMYLEGPNWSDSVRTTVERAEKLFNFVRDRFRSITAPVDKILNQRFSINNFGISNYLKTSLECKSESLTYTDQMTLRTAIYPRVFLAGWSRGGAGVVYTSNLLQNLGIPVYCLLLYDAVNRTSLHPATTLWHVDNVPTNVEYCYHALRDPATYSRQSFGNCGTDWSIPTKYLQKYFFCTHGGMGGVPWTIGAKDLQLSPLNANEMKDPASNHVSYSLVEARALDPAKEYIMEPTELVSPVTNLTVEQDRLGSAEVWKWMTKNLYGALAQAPSHYIG